MALMCDLASSKPAGPSRTIQAPSESTGLQDPEGGAFYHIKRNDNGSNGLIHVHGLSVD